MDAATANTVTVSFTDQTGGLLPHRAYYRTATGPGEWTVAGELAAGETSFEFVGLESATPYDFTFASFEGSLESALATLVSFTTEGLGIAGDVTVPITVAATMEFSPPGAIVGDVTVSITVASGLLFTQHAEIEGDVTVSVGVAAAMSFTPVVDEALLIDDIEAKLLQRGGIRIEYVSLDTPSRGFAGNYQNEALGKRRRITIPATVSMDWSDMETAEAAWKVPGMHSVRGKVFPGETVNCRVADGPHRVQSSESGSECALSLTLLEETVS